MDEQNPMSPKVIASAAGAGAGASVSSLLLWLLGVIVWGQPVTASAVEQALSAVPAPVSGIVVLVVTVVSSAIFGWRVNDPNRVSTSDLMSLERARSTSTLPADRPTG